MKGETVDELTGFAHAMRDAAVVVPIEDRYRPVLDTCGTGGNGTSTFNISTVTAFVVAGAGVRVAKHGNQVDLKPLRQRGCSGSAGRAHRGRARRLWRGRSGKPVSVFCLPLCFTARLAMCSRFASR